MANRRSDGKKDRSDGKMSRLAFITGATSGIGLATARALAGGGYRLALAARRKDRLEEVCSEIEEKYAVRPEMFVMDVREEEQIHAAVDQCVSKNCIPDILINDAGLARGLESYEKTSVSDIQQMIDTNIRGLFLVTHEFLPFMVQRNTGHIVNIGSTAGLYAYAGAAVYCATKAAVKTFSDGIRIDVIQSDIKVTTVQPGIVETPFSEIRFHGDREKAKSVYQGIEALHPEDIADVILYALSAPKRVQIADVVVMANQQATGFMVYKKNK